jgi:hypothetical protein
LRADFSLQSPSAWTHTGDCILNTKMPLVQTHDL